MLQHCRNNFFRLLWVFTFDQNLSVALLRDKDPIVGGVVKSADSGFNARIESLSDSTSTAIFSINFINLSGISFTILFSYCFVQGNGGQKQLLKAAIK